MVPVLIASTLLLAAADDSLPKSTKVVRADDWSALFRRTSGWTGGDGIFAIPLSGYEGPDRAADDKTLFVFSDTFIGEVDSAGKRKNATMINNSLAILEGGQPDPSKIRFLWGRNDKGAAASAFLPRTPSTASRTDVWYWLQDGFSQNGFVYNLPLIVEKNPAGTEGFQFKEAGIGLIKIPLDSNGEPDLAKAEQRDTPLFHSGSKTFYFGCGIFVNTKAAGVPEPDDSIYVYGRNGLYVARVHGEEFEDFSKWRYWDGTGWNADIAKAASLGLGGPELSVMPIRTGVLKGKYVLVSMGIGKDLYLRIGSGPAGPFGPRLNFAVAPELDTALRIYTYNAKAHPSLSSNGDWLITYNVNTSDWNRNLADADIYRPRFMKLRFDPATALLPRGRAARKGYPGLEWKDRGEVTGQGRRIDGRRPHKRLAVPRPRP